MKKKHTPTDQCLFTIRWAYGKRLTRGGQVPPSRYEPPELEQQMLQAAVAFLGAFSWELSWELSLFDADGHRVHSQMVTESKDYKNAGFVFFL